MNRRYADAVSYIEGLSNALVAKDSVRASWKLDMLLPKMQHFLDLIGNPEKGLKFVHVTGTGGKGTVSSLVHSMLVADGKKAGLFTSPYSTTAIEEIKVDDLYIPPDEFADIVEFLKPFVEKAARDPKYGRPSAFGLFFAVALLYFKRQKCEWAVIEVGIGGRYDFTNVIQEPKAAVITHIDYDHTKLLGKSIREIALDKAGIIKRGCQFFTAERRPAVRRLFEKACRDRGAAYAAVTAKPSEDHNLPLAGAIGAGLGISRAAIEKGIASSHMPCRFEIMERDPFIILDGAHNRSKMRDTVRRLGQLRYRKLVVIIAASNLHADNLAVLPELVPFADAVIATGFDSTERRKSIHPNALVARIKKFIRTGAKILVIQDPHEALATARKTASSGDCILVTGSFFLAGELRKEWYPEAWVLKRRTSFK